MKLKTLLDLESWINRDKDLKDIEDILVVSTLELREEAARWWKNMEKLEREHTKMVTAGKNTVHDKVDFGQWLFYRFFDLGIKDIE